MSRAGSSLTKEEAARPETTDVRRAGRAAKLRPFLRLTFVTPRLWLKTPNAGKRVICMPGTDLHSRQENVLVP
jgi:hypothetical protein